MSRICIFHQSLEKGFGGAASVCSWFVEALKDDHELYLATPDKTVDFAKLNDLYGTSIDEDDVNIYPLAVPSWLDLRFKGKLKSLKLAFAVRALKRSMGDFDLVITTVNEIALPTRAVQYVYCPIRSRLAVHQLYRPPERWLRYLNNILFKLVAGTFHLKIREDTLMIADARWIATMCENAYGIETSVIYPPIKLVDGKVDDPGQGREQGFVTIGRLVPEKRIEEAIEIIDRVRDQKPDIHLHIVGDGTGPYAESIKKLAEERGYVRIHERLSRSDLTDMLRSHAFGIHTTRNEHFGMAPAEIATAGAIVFVHRSGGPIETVGAMQELMFDEAADAAEKIVGVIDSTSLQDNARRHLAKTVSLYSPQTFISEVKQAVGNYFKESNVKADDPDRSK